MSKVLSLLVGRDDGIVESYFGIEHEGKLWLVTAWLRVPGEEEFVPERMIRVDSFQKAESDRFDFSNIQLPRAVIEGVGQTPGFEVRSLPDSPRVHRSDLFELPRLFP